MADPDRDADPFVPASGHHPEPPPDPGAISKAEPEPEAQATPREREPGAETAANPSTDAPESDANSPSDDIWGTHGAPPHSASHGPADSAPRAERGVRSEKSAVEKRTDVESVVGIAASAGGLEALREFLAALDPKTGMTYVIAQHMSPRHRSTLVDLLSRATSLPVSEAEHGHRLRPNHVYVGPPNRDVFVENDRIGLRDPLSDTGPRPSADYLFASLAEAYGPHAIGIVLSGTGTDGSLGVRAINAAGGISMAQTPHSAKFGGMPTAAAQAGVDFVLDPYQLASRLRDFSQTPRAHFIYRPNQADPGPSPLDQLLEAIHQRRKIDFRSYKRSTILRQVERRMAVNRVADIDSYLRVTKDNPDELDSLASSFMVCVTSFFRDPEAFEVLREAIKKTIEAKRETSSRTLRIWVPGCATGEEAYSIGILVAEELGDELESFTLQIFATDLSKDSLEFARKGRYSEKSLEHLDPQILDRWFHLRDRAFELDRKIRGLVLFSSHNLQQDPPFLRLDLVSCRNVLIYLKPTAQAQALDVFSYALLPKGYLFLGSSETIGHGHDEVFEVAHGKTRLYRKRFDAKVSVPRLNPSFGLRRTASDQPPKSGGTSASFSDSSMTQTPIPRTLLDAYVPPTVRITAEGRVLEVWGDTEPFLKLRPGVVDYTIFSALPHEIGIELKALIVRVARSSTPHRTNPYRVTIDGQEKKVQASLHPLDVRTRSQDLLVSFELLPSSRPTVPSEGAAGLDSAGEDRLAELQHELAGTKENLQSVIEELETSNEELQSVHEEAQAVNEELQATIEELQTTNAELEATNSGLSEANADLTNIEDSQGLATMVVASDFTVRRFNEGMRAFMAIPHGRRPFSVDEVYPRFPFEQFHSSVREALRSHVTTRVDFAHGAQSWKEVSVSPYRPAEDVRGATQVAIVVRDITRSVRSLEKMAEQHRLDSNTLWTGGVAHEFHNLLAVIVSNTELICEEESSPNGRADRDARCEAVLEAALKASDLTQSLLSIAGHGTVEPKTVDLREIIQDAMPLLRSAGGRTMEVTTAFEAGPLMTTVDVSAFRTVLLHLIHNAAEAHQKPTPGQPFRRGSVGIVVSHCAFATDVTLRGGALEAGPYVTVSIIDDGPGMTPDVKGHALEPFFSTKDGSGISGVGLPRALGFATQFGGNLDLSSERGQGTAVTLYLPNDIAANAKYEELKASRLAKLEASGILKHRNVPELQSALRALASATQSPRALLCVMGEAGPMTTIASYGLDPTYDNRPLCLVAQHLVDSGSETMSVNDATTDPRFAALPLFRNHESPRSFNGAPVRIGGISTGVLMVMNDSPRRLSEPKRNLVKHTADLVSECIADGNDFSSLSAFSESLESGTPNLSLHPLPEAPPSQPRRNPGSETPSPAPPSDRPGLKVLVVDDEESLATVVGEIVRQLGHSATLAFSADEALNALRAEHFDVLLSDIVMPGRMDGVALVTLCKQEFPTLRCILTTGYGGPENVAHAPTTEWLEKPYRKADLAALLAQA